MLYRDDIAAALTSFFIIFVCRGGDSNYYCEESNC